MLLAGLAVAADAADLPKNPAAGSGNSIVPDGSTQTSVSVSGNVSNITTRTLSGGNAFNSFSTFAVGKGNVANLRVPSSAANLINLVHKAPVAVNGVLNSYKNGKIGGNVYFADPYGFVVGKSGTVNVGSLSVSTPTPAFMNSVISPSGAINSQAVGQLLHGNIPVSQNGLVSIHGTVNAREAVHILAHQVDVLGHVDASHAAQAQQLLFSSSVNTKGLKKGTAIRSNGGVIEIVATGKASVTGSLTANDSAASQAGTVQVLARGNLSVGRNAVLSASAQTGNNSGGHVRVYAGRNVRAAAGSQFLARAAGTGNGGTIEVSAGGTAAIAGGYYDASSPAGAAGTVLFDPIDILSSGSIYSNGSNESLSAADSITVEAGAEINTRMVASGGNADTDASVGNSGDITLTAPTITINGALRADASGTYTPGNITLTATQSDVIGGLGKATAGTAITLNGIIKGGAIDIEATSTAVASFDSSASSIAEFAATTLIPGGLIGGNVAAAIGDATATVAVGSGAQIVGSGNVTLGATTTETAQDPALALTSNSLSGAVAVGLITGTAKATVASGATLSAGGDLTVEAANTPTLSNRAVSVSNANNAVGVTVAYGQADVTADAEIDSGATIAQARNVTVTAVNNNSFSNNATALADTNGNLGVAVAVDQITTGATAHLGASLGSTSAPVGNVVVQADNLTGTDSNTASTAVGTGISGTITSPLVTAASGAQSYLAQKLPGADTLAQVAGKVAGSTSSLHIASATEIGVVGQTTTANIGADNGGSAPSVTSNGNVSVVALTQDDGIRGDAISTIDSQSSLGTQSTPNGLSAGIAFNFYTHTTTADIGDGATVSAANVGVNAETIVPVTITWLDWDSFGTLISHINGNLGLGNDVLTTNTQAASNANNLGLAGSFDVLNLTNNTKAWIGTGASVTASASAETQPWTAALPTGAYAASLDFAAPITVNAYNLAQTLNISGNYSIKLNGTGGSQNATGVGGAFDNVYYDNTTLAGVYAGAKLDETGSNNTLDVAVTAHGTDQALLLTPSTGFGSSIGVNGALTFDEIENTTEASISNEAQVTAGAVDIAATQDLAVWNVSGTFSTTNNVGVGITVGANYLNTDTQAFVGDNSGVFGATLPSPAPSGFIHAASLDLTALTDGQANALGIVGSETSSSSPSSQSSSTFSAITSKLSALTTSLQTSLSGAFSGSTSTLGQYLNSKFASLAPTPVQGPLPGPAQPPYGVGVSGSAAVNATDLTTKAYIDTAALNGLTTGTSPIAVTVQALDETGLVSAAGDAAFVSAGAPSSSYSAAAAGAVAFGLIDNTTEATITNSTLVDANQVAVRALSGGFETAVALGIAVNTGSSNANAASDGAGSFSGNVVTNTTKATVSNSTLSGISGDSGRSLEVTAYDQTLIGTGGGSFYGGGTTGVGVALTLGDVSDTISAAIDGGSATQYDTITVQALDASQIVGGGAMGGGSGDASTGIAGGLIFNGIENTISATVDGYTPAGGSETQAILGATGAITVQAMGTGPVSRYASALTNDGGTPIGSNINLAANFSLGTSPISFGNGNLIIGFAGVFEGNFGGSNLGLGLVVNTIADSYSATIADASVTSTGGTVSVTAQDNGTIIGAALGLGLATGPFAGVGAVTINVIGDHTTATIGSSSAAGTLATVTADTITVTADNNAAIYSVAGNVAIGIGQESDGLALAYAQTADTANATVAAASLTATGAVSDTATNGSTIYEVAVDGAFSGNTAIGGSAAISVITDGDTATLGSATGTTTVNAGALTVSATDGGGSGEGIYSLAGNITYGSQTAYGLALSVNSIDNTTTGEIDNASLDVSGDTNIDATFTATIESLAAAGGASGNFSVGASSTSNNIGDTLIAAIVGSSNQATGGGASTDAGTTTVAATDDPTIQSLAGAVEGSNNSAVGVAAAINIIGDNTSAYIQGTGPTGGDWEARDVVVNAASTATIDTVAVGAAATTQEVAGAGSLAVDVLTDSVTSDISGGASVTAQDNVGVLAANSDTIQTIAGVLSISGLSEGFGDVGVGVGLTVNYLHGTTNAYISGANTVVNALAKDDTDQLSVPDGTLASPPDVSGVTLSGYVAPNLAENTKEVTGLAVNAESLRTVTDGDTGLTVSGLRLGGLDLDLIAGVNVLGGSTNATISQATINAASGAAAAQNVDVLASSHDFAANFVLATTGNATIVGTTASAAAAVNVFAATTNASLNAATVTAAGGVDVAAVASQDGSGLAIGLAASLFTDSGTGTGIVNVFDGDTEAYVVGGSVTAGSLSVAATSENSMELAGGSATLNIATDVGITLLVAVNEDTTKAYIGDSADQTATDLTVPGTVSVTASSTATLGDTAVAAALTASTGVAGMVAIDVVTADTEADIYDTNLDQGTTQGSAATVTATSTLNANSYTGALAAGSTAGVGGAVNLLDAMGQTKAAINSSAINAASVAVTATATNDLDLVTATGGLAASGGLSASVGVLLIDLGPDNSNLTTAENQSVGSIGVANQFLGADLIAADQGNGLSNADESAILSATPPILSLYKGQGNGTAATISGGTITAATLLLSATDTTQTQNIAGAGGIGVDVGGSAAIAATSLNAAVGAGVASGTALDIGSSITVIAAAQDGSGGHAGEADAYAGGLGLGAFGAAVALATENDTVTAFLDGTVQNNPTAQVSAGDSSTLSSDGVGAAGGALAAGLVVSSAQKGSSVTASASPTGADAVAGLSLVAAEGGTVDASGISAAVGVAGAGDGVGSTAEDTSSVTAFIGPNTRIATGSDGVSLMALANPETSATATGVSGSLDVGLGASVALAESDPIVNAIVENAASITGAGGLSITAEAAPQGSNPTANSFAVAGAGGLVGADAAVATASDNAQVQAYTGTGVTIPDGAVTISATNLSAQTAVATDVAAGVYAAGAAVAIAEAGNNTTMLTNALLGDGATGSATRCGTSALCGAIMITADGSDTNQASSTAGSGGVIAGDASVAQTSDTSNVTAGIGSNINVGANPLTAATFGVSAVHTANYGTAANSINAAVLGGSGSQATNTVESSVAASTGDNDLIAAAGPTPVGTPGIVLVAQNNYDEQPPSGASYSAQGGGGGVANAAAALSTITLLGETSVTTGTSDQLTSGSDPVNNPGGILLSASTILNGSDSVDMETGGGFEGSGTNDSLATSNASHPNGLTNTVTIGSGDTLASEGDIGAGTYTLAQASTDAYSSTWAAVGVADAIAETNLVTTQNVTVGAGTTISAFGNIDLTAGQDPTGSFANGFNLNSVAQGYVRGLIAIPAATATTDLVSNASLTIGSGTKVDSAQDVDIGAFEGTKTLNADGTGHGFELGFIPATNHDSNSNDNSTPTTVTIDGSVVAGYYSNLAITIANCADTAGTFCSTFTEAPTTATGGGIPLGSPAQYWMASFDPQTFIASNTSSAGGTAAATAEDNSSSTPVGAFVFPTLFASGGEVTINAGQFNSSSGSVTANGGPSISITNASPDYLVFGAMLIPNNVGGQILFTGAAGQTQAQNAGIGLTTVNANVAPAITVADTYSTTLPSQYNNTSTGALGPNLIFTGPVQNIGGGLTVDNATGSYLEIAEGSTNVLSLNVDTPQGVFVVGPQANSNTEFLGGSPIAEWQNSSKMIWPGGNPSTVQPDPLQAIAWVATYAAVQIGQSTGLGSPSSTAVMNQSYLIGNNSAEQVDKYGNVIATAGDAAAGQSTLFFSQTSACLPANSGNCGTSTSVFGSDSSLVSTYAVDPTDCCHNYYFPGMQMQPLSSSAADYSFADLAGSNGSTIHARSVLVQAALIDVDGTLSVGSNWSVNLPASLTTPVTVAPSYSFQICIFGCFTFTIGGSVSGGALSIDQYNYQHYGSGPSFNIPGLSGIAAGDAVIQAQYNAQTNQITLGNVNAAQAGASVTLDGAIFSTNMLGNISVNGGLGHVSVANQTGLPVVLQNIDTGNVTASTVASKGSVQPLNSTVEIEDTLQPAATNTTWYVFAPGGTTIDKYVTSNGASYAGTTPTVINGATASYNPVSGLRFNWNEVAKLSRSVTINYGSNPVSAWTWNGSSNNPWQYIVAPGSSLTTAQAIAQAYQDGELTTTSNGSAAGYLTTGNATSLPVFQEEIAATYGGGDSGGISYHGCGGSIGSGCNFHFVETSLTGCAGSNPCSNWYYYYPGEAALILSMSVKADNAIGISFTGNTSGLVSVNSDAPVILAGQINNPTGATDITAGGSITETATTATAAQRTLLTNNLNLTASGGIGAAGAPFGATLTQGGAVNAQSGPQGVYLTLASSGGALVGQIAAGNATTGYGPVSLASTLSLNPQTPGSSFVQGDSITLTSSQGGIGNLNPLIIKPMVSGAAGSGAVNIAALNDINILAQGTNLQTGNPADLLVGTTPGIVSTAGNVTINVSGGGVLDAASETPGETLSAAQLQAIRQNLHLLGSDAQSNATMLFEKQVDSQYRQYWLLLDNGSYNQASDTFTLNSATLANFNSLAAAYLNIDPTTITASETQTYANQIYHSLTASFATTFGADWATQTQFATFQPSFLYIATAAQAAALGGQATWTVAQLADAVDQAALQGGTVVGVGNANIAGHNVSITTGGGLGSLLQPLQISVNDLVNGTLTNTEAAALAVATTPGQVTQNVTTTLEYVQPDGSFSTSCPSGTCPQVQVATGGTITVQQQAPLFVAALGTFSGATNGTIYLQSTTSSVLQNTVTNLTLGQVSALGDVNIAAPGAIASAASVTGPNILTPGNVTLAAGGGDIGSSSAPLQLSIGGKLLSATAQHGSLYLDEVPSTAYVSAGSQDCLLGACSSVSTPTPVNQDQDLTITQIIAQGTASLAAQSGSILADPAPPASVTGPNVAAATISLTASNNITGVNLSASGNASLGAGGTIGGVTISAPVVTLNAGSNIGSLSGAAPVVIDQAAADSTPPTGNQLAASGAVLNATAGGQIYLYSPNDPMIVGTITSGTSCTTAGCGDLYLTTALGFDLLAQDLTASEGDINAAAGGSEGIANYAAANGSVTLTAVEQKTSNITVGTASDGGGSSSGPVVVNVSNAFTVTPGTSITTGSTISVSATSITMDAGSSMTAGGQLSLTTSSGDMTLGALTSGLAPGGGTAIQLNSGGAIVGNGDGETNLSLTGVCATQPCPTQQIPVSLQAADAIGSATLPITLAVPTAPTPASQLVVAANSANSGIWLSSASAGGTVLQNIGVPGPVSVTTTVGDLTISQITSAATGSAITVQSAGAVLGSGGNTASPNLVMTGSSAQAAITAQSGIGSAAQAIYVDPGSVTATSTTGDIWLHALDGTTATLVWAKGGSVNLSGDNALNFGTVHGSQNANVTAAGSLNGDTIIADTGSVDVTATTGNATLSTISAGASVTFTVGGTLTFTNLSGGPTSISAGGSISFGDLTSTGAISITSRQGDVIGTTVTATGNAALSGVGVEITALGTSAAPIGGTTMVTATGPASATDPLAGQIEVSQGLIGTGNETLSASGSIAMPAVTSSAGSLTLAAGQNIAIPSISAKTNIASTAGGTTVLTTATSGGAMSFTSGGEISFTTLSAGGNLAAVSAGGDVVGTTVTATGNAALSGVGIELAALGTSALPIGGTTMVTATGPASATDPLAGQIAVSQGLIGVGDETLSASGSVTMPAVTASAGSLTLAAGQNIAIPTITAATSIAATAGGTTTLTTATSGGAMSFTSGGALSFTTLSAGGNLAAVSTGGDVIGTTVTAAGNAALSGVGIGLLSVNAAGPISVTASGATSLADPYAGNIVIDSVTGSGQDTAATPAIAMEAVVGSIFVPTVVAQNGSITLTAGDDIEVPFLTAASTITTTAGYCGVGCPMTNGVTNIVTATAGGAINLTGGQTITFRQLTSGGNLSVISNAGFVLGVASLDPSNYATVSSNLAIDGSVTAGGSATLAGAGIGVLNVTAKGPVTMTASGFPYSPTYTGPNLPATEPDLIDLLGDLWNISAGLAQTPPDMSALVSLFDDAGGDLTHGSTYALAAAPPNFANLTKTLTDVTAGLLTLSPTPLTKSNWPSVVSNAYNYPPNGTTSGPVPDPWSAFNPVTALSEPGQGNVGWWTGGIDFLNIVSGGSVTLQAGSVIKGSSVSAVCNYSATAGTVDGEKSHVPNGAITISKCK